MYYVAYQNRDSKEQKWKVFGNKKEVFDFFKQKVPKKVPDSNELSDLDKALGKWTIAKLTTSTRGLLEKHFEKKGNELEGKGEYLPDLIKRIQSSE